MLQRCLAAVGLSGGSNLVVDALNNLPTDLIAVVAQLLRVLTHILTHRVLGLTSPVGRFQSAEVLVEIVGEHTKVSRYRPRESSKFGRVNVNHI